MGIWDSFFEKARNLLGNAENAEPKKRCYYELLEVDKDATEDEIKRSYKKLALKWHPDKNPERQEECAAFFVILQQAYEVLCDPQERAFYDRHRENIIHGGEGSEETKDMGLKVGGFFDKSCFSGFGDDEFGFYTIYRELFHKLAAEEYAYIEDLDDRNYPVFGKSGSDYEAIVDPFYAFWMDFSTKRSFAWVDHWDMRQAQDRPTARVMEKENKKLRDAAKKARNDEIQKLVMHIRKLDKRVKQNRERLELKRAQQLEKAKEQQMIDIRRNLENIGEYEVSEEAKLEHLRNLEEIENQLDAEFGTVEQEDGSGSERDSNEENLSCIVCEKFFKTSMAFHNHQKSRKHKQMVETLRKHMKEDDQILFAEECTSQEDEDAVNNARPQLASKKKKKKKGTDKANVIGEESSAPVELLVEEVEQVKIESGGEQADEEATKAKAKPKKKNQSKAKAAEEQSAAAKKSGPTVPVQSSCQTCSEVFESRSKLFAHLKDSGHASLKTSAPNVASAKLGKKGKTKK